MPMTLMMGFKGIYLSSNSLRCLHFVCAHFLHFPSGSAGMQGTQQTLVQYLGREDPREKEMETLSSVLAWKIPWTKKPGRLESLGSQRVRHN